MNGLRLSCLCLGLLAASAAGAAPAADPAEAQVRELARTWLAHNDGVGLSIGVYDNGQRRFYNLGAARLDGDKPPTKDTIYEIGSISKTFAGQLLARAVVEGRANLADTVDQYLGEPYPNLANGSARIQLVHLANMTSQLIDNIPDLTQVRPVPGEPAAATKMRVFAKYTRQEMLLQLHRVAPRLPPGSDPVHSNVASMLLGIVLEKIYDEEFADLVTNEIEKPLKMGSGTNPNRKLLAKGYTQAGEELPSFDAEIAYPSGSLRYSADDLLRYAAWQMVEKDASTKLAHQGTWFTADRRQSVALYWITAQSPAGRRLTYSGSTYGFASVCDLYPDAKVAVVLLANKATDGAQDTLRALSAKIVGLLRPAPATSPSSPSAVSPPTAR